MKRSLFFLEWIIYTPELWGESEGVNERVDTEAGGYEPTILSN